MATIEYKFSDGHIEEIEVTEEFAKQYKEIDKEYFRNEEKFDWRTRNKEMSMERLQKEFGMDMPDDAPAVDEQVINEDFIKRFISVLTEPQKEIFKKAYIENKSLRLISRETNMHRFNQQSIEGVFAHLKMSERLASSIYNMVFAILKDEPVLPVQIELGYLDDVPKRFTDFLGVLLVELSKESEKEDGEEAEDIHDKRNDRKKLVS